MRKPGLAQENKKQGKNWFSIRKQRNKGTRKQGKKGKNLVEDKMEDDGEEGGDDDRTTDGTEEQL